MKTPLEHIERAIALEAKGQREGLLAELIAARDGLLSGQQAVPVALRRGGNLLWRDGAEEPGPYCMACHDERGAHIRIHVGSAGAVCPSCKRRYTIANDVRRKYGFPEVPPRQPAFSPPPRRSWMDRMR